MTDTQDNDEALFSGAPHANHTVQASVGWAFGNLAETALRRGFRCPSVVRNYQRWLEEAAPFPNQELLLFEREFQRSLFRLVAHTEHNEFRLIASHESFLAIVDVSAAGSGSSLELVTVGVSHFAGNLRKALIWGADVRAWFQTAKTKRNEQNNTRSESPEQAQRLWFGERNQTIGKC